MKRIIDGKTYNTATASHIARSWWTDRRRGVDVEMEGDLFQTPGGAFFLVEWERDAAEGEDDRTSFYTMTPQAAQRWVETGEVELYNETVFPLPPEAGEEQEGEATVLYVRVPRALKNQIEARAQDENVSVNSWMLRCMERCSRDERVAQTLWRAHYIATTITAVPDGYGLAKCVEGMAKIAGEIEHTWSLLGLPRVKGQDLAEDVILYGQGRTEQDWFLDQWQPFADERSAS